MGLTAAATVIGFIVNRFTKDVVTPSKARMMEQSGIRAFGTRPGVSDTPEDYQTPRADSVGLPVYDGATTAKDTTVVRHRVEGGVWGQGGLLVTQ